MSSHILPKHTFFFNRKFRRDKHAINHRKEKFDADADDGDDVAVPF